MFYGPSQRQIQTIIFLYLMNFYLVNNQHPVEEVFIILELLLQLSAVSENTIFTFCFCEKLRNNAQSSAKSW